MKTCQIIVEDNEAARVLTDVLINRFGAHLISIRHLLLDYLRGSKGSGSLAFEMNAFLNRNEFIPNALIEQMIFTEIESLPEDDIVITWYPRTVEQFVSFYAALEQRGIVLTAFWYFKHIDITESIATKARNRPHEDVLARVQQYATDIRNTVCAIQELVPSEHIFQEVEYGYPFDERALKETMIQRITKLFGNT